MFQTWEARVHRICEQMTWHAGAAFTKYSRVFVFSRTNLVKSLLKKVKEVASQRQTVKKDGSRRQPGAWLWNLLGADPSEKPNHSCSQTALSAAAHLCFGETSSAPKKKHLFFFFFNPSFVLQCSCRTARPRALRLSLSFRR